MAEGQSAGSARLRARWEATTWSFDLVHGLCKSSVTEAIAAAACDVIAVRSFSPSPLNVSTGDDASAHTMTLDYLDPADSSQFFNFPQTFRANVGGTGQTTLSLDGFYGRSPIHTTVQARPAGSSDVFTMQPQLSGHTFPQEVRIVVPPQILIQMMHNEARDLSSSTVRSLIGWAMRNRFSDSQYFSNQTTYQAAILAGATYDATTNGVQPELNAAASVFDGSADPTSGCQGFWSPTASQWQVVQQALNSGTTTLPTGVGIPFNYGGHPELTQIVYISSVGQSNSQNAPAFLFVRKRSSNSPAVVSLN